VSDATQGILPRDAALWAGARRALETAARRGTPAILTGESAAALWRYIRQLETHADADWLGGLWTEDEVQTHESG
jgi:hypothetical protein